MTDTRIATLEQLDKHRDKARASLQTYQKRIIRAYDVMVRPRVFQERDLVLRVATHVMQGISTPKFMAKWEGPYIVKEANASHYYHICEMGGDVLSRPINAKWLKLYYAYSKMIELFVAYDKLL